MKDPFGFEKEEIPSEVSSEEQDLPIRAFSNEILLQHLTRDLGERRAKRLFVSDCVQYGEKDGSLRVKINPNLCVFVQRLTTALDGGEVWVTKRYYKIKNPEYAGREDVVANEIFQHLQKIAKEKLDSGSKEYDRLFYLAKDVYHRINKSNPMFFQQGIKKISDTNYIIVMNVSAFGTGKLSGGKSKSHAIPTSLCDFSYDHKTGIIKVSFYSVSIEGESGSWEIDVPLFVSYFAPSQDQREIADVVVNGIKFI